MSTYQCLDLAYVIDVMNSFLSEKHFFFLQHSIYKKEETIFFINKKPALNKQERNLPQIKTQRINHDKIFQTME